MLAPGAPAPHFALPDQSGAIQDAKALKGKRYLVYFYPKDSTPGCTVQACGIQSDLAQFNKLGIPLLAFSYLVEVLVGFLRHYLGMLLFNCCQFLFKLLYSFIFDGNILFLTSQISDFVIGQLDSTFHRFSSFIHDITGNFINNV